MKRPETLVRVIIPDSHGSQISKPAKDAFLADLKLLNPHHIVFLGDFMEAGGRLSKHPPESMEELQYAQEEDESACIEFFDEVQEAAPNAEEVDALAGNHEFHFERFAVEHLPRHQIARYLREFGPEGILNFKKRGWKYHSFMGFHDGLAFRNTIKRGKCYFTHGMTACKHAAAAHLEYFKHNVIFGHVHRAQEFTVRTVDNEAIFAACPGTLAGLQPAYFRTTPTAWIHGYGLQFVSRSGYFQHINVKIINGVSMLYPKVKA